MNAAYRNRMCTSTSTIYDDENEKNMKSKPIGFVLQIAQFYSIRKSYQDPEYTVYYNYIIMMVIRIKNDENKILFNSIDDR